MAQSSIDVLVVGTGLLARQVCLALARSCAMPLRVAVMGRSGERVGQLTFVAEAAACAASADVTFVPLVVDFASIDSIEAMMVAAAPRIVLSCVSYHSPWESMQQTSAWTELIRTAGFGVTLPLQWRLTSRVFKAAERALPEVILINGCFPDAVNTLLKAQGSTVCCGIGNVSTLAAGLQARLGIGPNDGLRMLAHHRHLHKIETSTDEALIWVHAQRLSNAGELLHSVRAIPRQEMCVLAGGAAATLMRNMLTRTEYLTHVPGPNGLPGGYPVRVRGCVVELCLPPEISQQDAIEWNHRIAHHDGVIVSASGDVTFSAVAQQGLRDHGCELADGFQLNQIEQACSIMLSLRERLRSIER